MTVSAKMDGQTDTAFTIASTALARHSKLCSCTVINQVCFAAFMFFTGAALFVMGSSFGDDDNGAVFTCQVSADHRY